MPNAPSTQPSEHYTEYAKFDADYGFAEKAGFQLSEFQIKDVEQFVRWSASLNTYEVGSGKTVVSTVVSLMRGVQVTLVIMPPILLKSWDTWLRKVSERVVLYRGSPQERAVIDLNNARWIVASLDIFRRDYSRLATALHARSHEVILDEAHSAKNPASVLFKKVQQASAGGYLQMLTGTPISKTLDAYAYIKLKTPNLYRNYTHFEATHVEERDFWKRPIRFGHLDMLKENLEIQTISRTKKEIHGYDLTPIFPDTSYELSPEHQRLYNKLVDEQLLTFDDGTKIDATTGPALRHALQQVVVNFDHFSNNPDNRSAAYDLIDQTIEETCCTQLNHSKLIIWTKYKMTSARVLAYCLKLGIKTVAAYSGSDSAAAAEAFMHDPETRILVANQQSAGAGLNPQRVCSEALYLEMDTVPIYNRQSIGRLDRVGQTVRPRMRIAVALGTVQVGLFHDMLKNDDMVERIEPSKDSLRKMLLGQL